VTRFASKRHSSAAIAVAEEVVKMAEDAGLRVSRLVCDAGIPIPGGRFLPRALGMILRRR